MDHSRIHGGLVYLAGLHVLDRRDAGTVLIGELSHVFAGEPKWSPHEVRVVAVLSITIKMDGGVERFTLRLAEKRLRNELRQRSFDLNTVLHHPDDRATVRVLADGKLDSRALVEHTAHVTEEISRKLVKLNPATFW